MEIAKALKWQKKIEVHGGASIQDHSYYVYDHIVEISDIYASPTKAIKEIQEYVKKEKINFIIPAHDQVVYELAHTGVKNVIGPEWPEAKVMRSKSLTYEYFEGKLNVPKVYKKPGEVHTFPVFIKPDQGQGSKGTRIINTRLELSVHRNNNELILEYLPGTEYTVDCFTDRHGNLRYTLVRERRKTSNGISTHSVAVIQLEATYMARIISKRLSLRGQWFFQAKEKNGRLFLMEIANRASGTSCLARMRGVNLPLLSIYDRMGLDVEIMDQRFPMEVSRALENKYTDIPEFGSVFVDYDDTMNYMILALLYKFEALGKTIYLVTRHSGSVVEDLEGRHIARNLFDAILRVMEDQDKSYYISTLLQKYTGIFIDDSHKERSEVAHLCPVFDVQQAIELFL